MKTQQLIKKVEKFLKKNPGDVCEPGHVLYTRIDIDPWINAGLELEICLANTVSAVAKLNSGMMIVDDGHFDMDVRNKMMGSLYLVKVKSKQNLAIAFRMAKQKAKTKD